MDIRDIASQTHLVFNVAESERLNHVPTHADLNLLDISNHIQPELDDMSLLVGESINQVVERFGTGHR